MGAAGWAVGMKASATTKIAEEDKCHGGQAACGICREQDFTEQGITD